ncbi:GNAT family N-acetyltransferase [Pseudonocardia bannensis]|uniref:GNAT family N-acetyltransferase n=1 Tax=Pseudonocardia bannensis TaxID=630973 RepID=A0A848DE30_9PSEU|nr:GNAT family N-acetyltransferase [Pseudonocardia bannensis]NMH90823.1 GNAT family N-acetyltransferase [Pseudonocardia bannensis]
MPLDPIAVATLPADELRAAHTLFARALHRRPVTDDGWSWTERSYVPERTVGVHVGGALAGTATSFPTRTAVPGGAALPTAAVTRVGVRADHTRRGLLSAMMRHQLADAAERGEVLATLRASETRIYGRFGYGVASRGRTVRVRARGAGWRAGAPAGGTVRLLDPDEVVCTLAALHDRLTLRRPGAMTRPDGWWSVQYGRRLADREPVQVAVHAGADGDDGFAVWTIRESGAGFGENTARLEDLHAADAGAVAGLWRFLLGLDLLVDVEGWLRPLDEPLELLLADPRDCTTTAVADETWLRLVDVTAALDARAWSPADPVLLAVHDAVLPRNAGIYRIGPGGVTRLDGETRLHLEPQLECDVAALSMAYLGDRTPSELAGSGWWRVHDAAALNRADVLFRTTATPWCGTFF